jgi:hypothetical protein
MSIFYLESSKRMIDLCCNKYDKDGKKILNESLIIPYYNRITFYFNYNWVFGSIFVNKDSYYQLCISDKGSVLYVYTINTYENNVMNVFIYGKSDISLFTENNTDMFYSFLKKQCYIHVSKYETISDVYSFFNDKILTMIYYPHEQITTEYLYNIKMILEEYLDIQNKLKMERENSCIIKHKLTENNNTLLKRLKQKDEEIKALHAKIVDLKEKQFNLI